MAIKKPATKLPARGIRNNNPMNIRDSATKWQGEVDGPDKAFEEFESPVYGIRAGAMILNNYQQKYGLRTVREIINRYAPPNENDTGAYVNTVAAAVGVSPDTEIKLSARLDFFVDFVTAVIRHENGSVPYDRATIEEGVKLALWGKK